MKKEQFKSKQLPILREQYEDFFFFFEDLAFFFFFSCVAHNGVKLGTALGVAGNSAAKPSRNQGHSWHDPLSTISAGAPICSLAVIK